MQPHVTIRVVPLAAGPHPGIVTGLFVVLRFPTTRVDAEPPTVYADGYTGGLYLGKPREVEAYDQAFRKIWEVAYGEEASRRLTVGMAGSYEQD